LLKKKKKEKKRSGSIYLQKIIINETIVEENYDYYLNMRIKKKENKKLLKIVH
jgi:hypothetical protein